MSWKETSTCEWRSECTCDGFCQDEANRFYKNNYKNEIGGRPEQLRRADRGTRSIVSFTICALAGLIACVFVATIILGVR